MTPRAGRKALAESVDAIVISHRSAGDVEASRLRQEFAYLPFFKSGFAEWRKTFRCHFRHCKDRAQHEPRPREC